MLYLPNEFKNCNVSYANQTSIRCFQYKAQRSSPGLFLHFAALTDRLTSSNRRKLVHYSTTTYHPSYMINVYVITRYFEMCYNIGSFG